MDVRELEGKLEEHAVLLGDVQAAVDGLVVLVVDVHEAAELLAVRHAHAFWKQRRFAALFVHTNSRFGLVLSS